MSSEIYYKNSQAKNKSTSKKSKQNSANKSKNKPQKQSQKYSNQIYQKKNNLISINPNLSNSSTSKKFHPNVKEENIIIKPNKNEFITFSEFPEMSDDNIYDNFDYLKVIQNKLVENENGNEIDKENSNPEKIRSVDANKYLNNQNKSISTFTELKLNLLNKKFEFNNPFVFNRNDVDLSSSKKIEEEKNYQIKKFRYLRAYRYTINPEIRKRNSKIIQKWWRKKINPKIDKRKKIIKIQSVFRGYLTRRNLNDIICISVMYQNFINKLRHALGNFVHRNYFPKRYYKKKYAFEKILPLKLKIPFRKWKKINDHYNEQKKAAGFLYKNRQQKRYILLILKTYFNIWKLKCQHLEKNEDMITSKKNQHRKYSAISKLFNKLEQIGNKAAFNSIKDNLHNYLKYNFQDKSAKKIFELYYKYKLKRYMKRYLDKWKEQNSKEKERNIRLKMLANEIKAQIRKNDKDYLRNNLNSLRTRASIQNINDLKRAKKEFLFPEAGRHITKCIRKNIIRLIFKEFTRKRSIEKLLLKIIQKNNKKHFLNKWKKIVKILLTKDKRKLYLKKIISKLSRFSNNIRLSKYFNKWRSKISINKSTNKNIDKYNNFCNALKKYITRKNKSLINHKKSFLSINLNKYINTNSNIIQKKLNKCIKNYANKDRNLKLKKAFDKWKRFVQYCKLLDLKGRNLKSISKLSKMLFDTKKLSVNLHQWKDKNNLINLVHESKIKKNIINVVDVLNKIKNNRRRQFFDIIRNVKIKLMKKIILKNLSKKHGKQKLSNYFNKWKINSIKLQNKYQFKNINKLNKLKDITNNKIKKQEIENHGSLTKYLYKWYFMSKLINKSNQNQFLKNIRKSLTILTSVAIRKTLRNSFDLIKTAEVSAKNISLNRIKKYFIGNDKKNLRKAFHTFLKNTLKDSKNIIKSNIIYKLKLKNEQMRDRTLLTKYFNKWRMLNNIYMKQRNNSTTLITNKLIKIFKRSKAKSFVKNMKDIKHEYYKDGFYKNLFDLYGLIQKRTLNKYLKQWKNNANKIGELITKKEKGYTIIYKTLSKAYSYKKLEESLIPTLINAFKKRYFNEFLNKFKKKYLEKINCGYKTLLKNEMISKKIHFSFKKTIKPNRLVYNNQNDNSSKLKNKIKEDSPTYSSRRQSRYQIPRSSMNKRKSNFSKEELPKNIIVSNSLDPKKDKFYNERLIPYLVNYLNELRLNKLRLVFSYFNLIKKNQLFCALYKSWTNKQHIPYKKQLIKSVKQSTLSTKLYKLMRKKIIHKLMTQYLLETKRRNDLLTLLYLIKVFKKFNKKKRTIKFLRIWRVYVKLLRDRAAQLEKFEKSFSETYEKLSDSIFVDVGDEKSVQTQVLSFLDKVNIEEKSKLKNNLGISQSSLNSYLSGKFINNDILNNSNFTFHNDDNENLSNISFSKVNGYNQDIDEKSVTNSNNTSVRIIKSTLFSKSSQNK